MLLIGGQEKNLLCPDHLTKSESLKSARQDGKSQNDTYRAKAPRKGKKQSLCYYSRKEPLRKRQGLDFLYHFL